MKKQEFINKIIDNNYHCINDIEYDLKLQHTSTIKDYKKEIYSHDEYGDVDVIIGTVTYMFEDGNVDVRGILEIFKNNYNINANEFYNICSVE